MQSIRLLKQIKANTFSINSPLVPKFDGPFHKPESIIGIANVAVRWIAENVSSAPNQNIDGWPLANQSLAMQSKAINECNSQVLTVERFVRESAFAVLLITTG